MRWPRSSRFGAPARCRRRSCAKAPRRSACSRFDATSPAACSTHRGSCSRAHGAFNKPRRATTIGRLRDRATFARIGGLPQQVRQLLIKEPGGPLLLPAAFSQFEEPLALILAHNRAFNPDHDCCFGYLNCFRGISHVDAYRGLSLQWHGDQLQGLRRDWAYKPDWTYICSSALPTTLLEQGFDLCEAQQRWELGEPIDLYSYFAAQARDACRYRSTPFEIQLLSPYIVHAASPALVARTAAVVRACDRATQVSRLVARDLLGSRGGA